MKRMDCINWDSAHPNTFFGGYTQRALSDCSERLPYYTKKSTKGISFLNREVDYDRELQYAIDAGIDFFAHCWYPSAPIETPLYNPGQVNIGHHIHELSAARKWHAASSLNNQIKIAAILGTYELHSKDYEELALLMQMACYEKNAEGHPLVFLFEMFEPTAVQAFEMFSRVAREQGLSPYWIGMINSVPRLSELTEAQKSVLEQMNAISAYAQTTEHVKTYEAFTEQMIPTNEARMIFGKPIVPLFSMSWNPTPRVKSPVPWIDYGDIDYAPSPNSSELIDAAHHLLAWTDQKEQMADYVLSFAWNEFEEGGWICPTKAPDGRTDKSRIQTFRTCQKILCDS